MSAGLGVVFVPALFIAGVVVLFFALAAVEHIWRMDLSEMRRRYERGQRMRMPKLKARKLTPNAKVTGAPAHGAKQENEV